MGSVDAQELTQPREVRRPSAKKVEGMFTLLTRRLLTSKKKNFFKKYKKYIPRSAPLPVLVVIGRSMASINIHVDDMEGIRISRI